MLFFADGFRLYSALADVAGAGWGYSVTSGLLTLSQSGGPNGKPYVRFSDATIGRSTLFRQFPTKTTCGVKFLAFYDGDSAGALRRHVQFRKGANNQVGLHRTAGGLIQIISGASTVLGTSSSPVPVNTWVDLELKVIVHATNGYAGVRLNNQLLVEATNVNTAPNGSDIDQIHFDGTWSDSNDNDLLISDLMLWDGSGAYLNDWLGPKQLGFSALSSDGALTEMTPSSGSIQKDLLDELPAHNGDTDYIEAISAGLRSSFPFEDIPSNVTAVHALIPVVYARTSAVGVASLKLGWRIGGTNYPGPNALPISGSFSRLDEIHHVSPATTNPFTVSEANAAEMIIESAA